MNKKRTFTVAAVLLVTTAALFASGASESDKLWFKANNVADASVAFLPGTRNIEMQTMDASGNVLETSQVTVYQTPINYGRYLDTRVSGDSAILDLVDRFFDGGVVTPFEDNLFDVDYDAAGTATVDGHTCTVYTVEMAFDRALLTYDPNYQASGDIVGWSFDDDDFNDKITATAWIDQQSGALIKLENVWKFSDVMSKGPISITQTVNYQVSELDGETVSIPATITTTGTLTQRKNGSGYYEITEFTMNETQSDFFYNAKFARGESVN